MMSQSVSSIYAALCYRLACASENDPLEKHLYLSNGITTARAAREPLGHHVQRLTAGSLAVVSSLLACHLGYTSNNYSRG